MNAHSAAAPRTVDGFVGSALDRAVATVARLSDDLVRRFPDDCTIDGRYLPRPADRGYPLGGNHGWTTSFPVASEWIAYELSGDPARLAAATKTSSNFDQRLRQGDDLDTHDLGFLYSLSSVAAYRLTAEPSFRATGIAAADRLMQRFLEPAGIIQAWGDLHDPKQRGRAIIDSLLNMPLLTWASSETGDPRYLDAVRRHTEQLRRHIVRPDGTTFHTFTWDPLTGDPLYGGTAQGASAGSCWARGQAWGIYGFALNARALDDDLLRDASQTCAEVFLSMLPADAVPYWDMVYGDDSDMPRDSSSAAIAVCGLLELADLTEDRDRATRYRDWAHRILASLAANYTPASPEDADALILHSVYDFPGGIGVDEGSLWGDYFYLEALMRVRDPQWRPYW